AALRLLARAPLVPPGGIGRAHPRWGGHAEAPHPQPHPPRRDDRDGARGSEVGKGGPPPPGRRAAPSLIAHAQQGVLRCHPPDVRSRPSSWPCSSPPPLPRSSTTIGRP